MITVMVFCGIDLTLKAVSRTSSVLLEAEIARYFCDWREYQDILVCIILFFSFLLCKLFFVTAEVQLALAIVIQDPA